jgi:hypothetical protein
VVDLGCGVGAWLSVFAAHGVSEVLGVDGPWVPRQMLRIPQECFRPMDLNVGVELGERFDLAVSLEAAEHLPEANAGRFVRNLVDLAPAVLFSAAVPGQGGTGHVNEQWPEYWAALFGRHGYEVVDALRPALWNEPALAPCIRQNVLIFASPDALAASAGLRAARDRTELNRLSMVHPGVFADMTHPASMSLRRTLGSLPRIGAAAVRRRGRARRGAA